jgi:hypothetical protein
VVAGVPAKVVRTYVPGGGWRPRSGPLERIEGVAKLPDPPG